MTIQTLPLSALLLSDLNVRKTERDADIAGLADSIAAAGLKQNLVVIPAHFSTSTVNEAWDGVDRWEGKFEVVDGGRRFQALQLLVADGRITVDHEVPCRVEDRGEARETSLIANLQRVAMNPADEFEAFAAIVDQQRTALGETEAIAYTAKRFGVTARHVEQRLRLAALAPEVLEALRTGTITLDSAKAYAGTADHELQLKVFREQAKSNWKAHAASIVRDALRQRSLSLNDRLVKFVGIEAYRAAGGRTENDLFMGTEGEERLTDVQLLEKLATEKAEPLIARRAKKDGFASGLLASPDANKWPKAPEGMERWVSYYATKPQTKAELKKCVAVYGIEEDGLEKLGHFHTPAPREESTEPQRDWAAERAASWREHQITLRAARMAVGPLSTGHLKGTPLENRVFWPLRHASVIEADDGENHVMLALQIRVPLADIEAHRADATILIDEEAAAAEARKAAEDAAAKVDYADESPAQPEPVEGEDEDAEA